jgi:superfamily I DNA/RNA helicase
VNRSWWRKKEEMDDDQRSFILLPQQGKYALVGPPGSGKTNLLLLRAEYWAGRGERNALIITYTNALANFIKTGLGRAELVSPDQIRTYHSWAGEHILHHFGKLPKEMGSEFNEKSRTIMLEYLREANLRSQTSKHYSAIYVDEAQDFTLEELEVLLQLSDNVSICGDERQGIFYKNGLEIITKLRLKEHKLVRHYRIGQRIARVADKLMPPLQGVASLESTSNYDPTIQGESSAEMHVCSSRDDQFNTMLGIIKIQLDAFDGDDIGIVCGKISTIEELAERFKATDLSRLVSAHCIEKKHAFSSKTPINILTIHSAKGTEFRAVHLYAVEDLRNYPLKRTKLAYTAITRAKTALHAYKTGQTSHALENAFSTPTSFELDDLFSGDS